MTAEQSNVTANETPMLPPKDTDTIQINEKEEQSVISYKKYYASTTLLLSICIAGGILCKGLEIFNVESRSDVTVCIANETRPKYWVPPNSDPGEHFHSVLGRIGYEKATYETTWDLLWTGPLPFKHFVEGFQIVFELKPHQRINHFPGTLIGNKIYLATLSKSKYVPKSFKLPEDEKGLLEYASQNPKAVFVEKSSYHRGVALKNVTEMNTKGDKFAQEYVSNPFLVDGFKFDMSVYVVVTSVEPLRVYYYNGDVLFRYCLEEYHPFDPLNLRKYVVGEEYRNSSQVPALARLHSELGLGMKEAFDVYVRSKGKDPAKMWREVHKAIRELFLFEEQFIIEGLQDYPSNNSNFFELFRADFIVDEDLKVYLLEVKLSPNMQSSNPANQLLYEQVLYSLFSLVGLDGPIRNYIADVTQQNCDTDYITTEQNAACMEKNAAAAMLSANKNIAVWGDECNSCFTECDGLCTLCLRCLDPEVHRHLLQAYREHLHRREFRRIFPPETTPHTTDETLGELTPLNRLMSLWYQGKCNQHVAWCT